MVVGAAAHYEEGGKVQVQIQYFVSGSASSDTNKYPRIKFVSNAFCLAAQVVKVTGTQISKPGSAFIGSVKLEEINSPTFLLLKSLLARRHHTFWTLGCVCFGVKYFLGVKYFKYLAVL